MKSPVTLEQVAFISGVSVSTVSRTLSGSAGVRPAKRAAVERAVSQLGYQPNALARGLARGRTMSVGVLTQDISSPFYGDMLRGIEQGLSGSGYLPIFADGHWHAEEELAALDVLLGRQVDALIVLGGFIPDARLAQLAYQLPLIIFGREVPELAGRCLRLDNFGAAFRMTAHLIEFGHRRIAHLAGPPNHRDARDRLAGYQAALKQAGLSAPPELILSGDFMEPSGFLAATRLLEGREVFSAIFAANDQMAYGARLALYRKGVRVPEDISLAGFDDLPGSSYTTPPLTTVRQPTFDLGVAVAGGVLRVLTGEPADLPALTPQLIIRESTAMRRPSPAFLER